jgi:hypothetical protein
LLFKTSTSLIQPEFKYVFTQNPKSTWVLEMQHQYEDEDPFYNPQLSVNPYQATSQNPNDPSAVFVNENALNIEQSRFVKQVGCKIDYFTNFEQKHIECNSRKYECFSVV